jgi:hypothetical protein
MGNKRDINSCFKHPLGKKEACGRKEEVMMYVKSAGKEMSK